MNKKRSLTFLILLLLLCVYRTTTLLAFTAAYDQVITSNGTTLANFKVQVKDKKIKAEANLGGVVSIMIQNNSGIYNYLPDQNMATRMPLDAQQPNFTADLPNYMEYLQKNNAEKTGAEKVQQYDCDIYEFKDPTTQSQTKVWLWTEKQFPVKMLTDTPQGAFDIALTNIQLDVPIDDKEFEIPEGVQITALEPPQE